VSDPRIRECWRCVTSRIDIQPLAPLMIHPRWLVTWVHSRLMQFTFLCYSIVWSNKLRLHITPAILLATSRKRQEPHTIPSMPPNLFPVISFGLAKKSHANRAARPYTAASFPGRQPSIRMSLKIGGGMQARPRHLVHALDKVMFRSSNASPSHVER